MKSHSPEQPESNEAWFPFQSGKDVRAFIETLAAQHGVTITETGSDRLANLITHLAGDHVTCDRTEKLLIALCRKDLVSGDFLVKALALHLAD